MKLFEKQKRLACEALKVFAYFIAAMIAAAFLITLFSKSAAPTVIGQLMQQIVNFASLVVTPVFLLYVVATTASAKNEKSGKRIAAVTLTGVILIFSIVLFDSTIGRSILTEIYDKIFILLAEFLSLADIFIVALAVATGIIAALVEIIRYQRRMPQKAQT